MRDLGSTNGTRINGMRVETGVLKPGDELAIAHFAYRLITTDPDDNAPTTLSPTSRSQAYPFSRPPGPDSPSLHP